MIALTPTTVTVRLTRPTSTTVWERLELKVCEQLQPSACKSGVCTQSATCEVAVSGLAANTAYAATTWGTATVGGTSTTSAVGEAATFATPSLYRCAGGAWVQGWRDRQWWWGWPGWPVARVGGLQVAALSWPSTRPKHGHSLQPVPCLCSAPAVSANASATNHNSTTVSVTATNNANVTQFALKACPRDSASGCVTATCVPSAEGVASCAVVTLQPLVAGKPYNITAAATFMGGTETAESAPQTVTPLYK